MVAAAPPEVNRAVSAAAAERHLFVNAVDDPPNASVYLGAVVRREGGVTLAISTAGRAPALAGLLREGLERLLPADLPTSGSASPTTSASAGRRPASRWKRGGPSCCAR